MKKIYIFVFFSLLFWELNPLGVNFLYIKFFPLLGMVFVLERRIFQGLFFCLIQDLVEYEVFPYNTLFLIIVFLLYKTVGEKFFLEPPENLKFVFLGILSPFLFIKYFPFLNPFLVWLNIILNTFLGIYFYYLLCRKTRLSRL